MPIRRATKGSSISTYAEFYNPVDGTPFQAVSPPRWVVRDFNGNQVASGVGVQDIKKPARWTCTFTLPLTCPATTDDNAYSLAWIAANVKGSSTTSNEYFEVVDELQPEPFETAQLVLLGQPFTAQLWVPFQPGTLSLRICDDKGNVYYAQNGITNFTAQPANSGWNYSIYINSVNSSNNPTINNGIASFNCPPSAYGVSVRFLYWNYSDNNGNVETIVNRLYIVNGTMVRMMDDLLRFLDRIRNMATIPQLRLSDVDLAHFALQGMDKFNATPPVNNGVWGLGHLPEAIYDNVKIAACIRWLQAQYLATGMTAFELNGQAVSLTSDQTQYLQGLESTLSAEYDASATTNKKALIRSRNFSAIGGYFGPTALLIARVPYGYAQTYLPTLPFLG